MSRLKIILLCQVFFFAFIRVRRHECVPSLSRRGWIWGRLQQKQQRQPESQRDSSRRDRQQITASKSPNTTNNGGLLAPRGAANNQRYTHTTNSLISHLPVKVEGVVRVVVALRRRRDGVHVVHRLGSLRWFARPVVFFFRVCCVVVGGADRKTKNKKRRNRRRAKIEFTHTAVVPFMGVLILMKS